jgi:DNA-binding NarL/FixJ family response regulator
MTTSTIKVVLADDHSVVRRGIRDFLIDAGDIVVVAEAENGTQAFNLAVQYQPDVVVLDIQMPESNGLEVARHLRAAGFGLGILILTAFNDPPYVKAALEAGANGYVLKSSQADEIVEAVHAVYEGKHVFDSVAKMMPPSLLSPETILIQLSEREQEVLHLAARGLTNKAIGFELFISDRTVQGHLANIYEKLGVSGRTEAVMRAVESGWLK